MAEPRCQGRGWVLHRLERRGHNRRMSGNEALAQRAQERTAA